MNAAFAKQAQGYSYIALSMLLQMLGYILVFKFVINSATMTALTFILSTLIFGAIAFRTTGKVFRIIRSNPWLFIQFNFYVFLMIAPVFLCEIHGVRPIDYALIFCATIAGMAAVEKRSGWAIFYFILTAITLYLGAHNTLYTLYAILGPIGAFQVLRLSTQYIQKHQASTSEIMILRFLLLSMLSLLFVRHLQFGIILTHWHIALIAVFIVLSLNALPIYCSQKAVAFVGHNTVAISFALMPILIFLGQLFFIGHYHIELLVMAILLFTATLLAKRYPLTLSFPMEDGAAS